MNTLKACEDRQHPQEYLTQSVCVEGITLQYRSLVDAALIKYSILIWLMMAQIKSYAS
jgi:hypothetical protein